MLAWHERDVIAIEVDDRRAVPEPIQINLRMLRSASQYSGGAMEKMIADRIVTVRTRDHIAASQIAARDGRILLTQNFQEGTHRAKSAVAIALLGRKTLTRFANETEVRIVSPAERGRVVILIASAATLDAGQDVAAAALSNLDAAAAKSFDDLAGDNAEWWHAFWQRGTIALHSADGAADEVADELSLLSVLDGRHVARRVSAEIQRHALEHRRRHAPVGHAALVRQSQLLLRGALRREPHRSSRSRVLDVLGHVRRRVDSRAPAMGQPGHLHSRNGLARRARHASRRHRGGDARSVSAAQAVGAAQRAVSRIRAHRSSALEPMELVGRRPWTNGAWVPTERPTAPFSPVNHILGTTAKVAYLYWRRYEYTQDLAWLRDRAYPMIKGAAEFYRHFPNLRKEADGKYHIHHVNSNESVMGAHDTDEDLSAMRGIFAAAIRASELLGQDAALRAQWQELLANLAPLPTSAHPDALRAADYTGAPVFVRGLKPTANNNTGFTPDGNSLPMWFFDLVNLESPDKQMLAAANATFDRTYRAGIGPTTAVGVLSKWAIAGTTLGRVDATRFLVPNQIRAFTAERQTAYLGGRPLVNRLTLREGPQALDAQRLGRAAEALQLALLQSAPGVPGGDSIIRLFPAWPDEWDAQFTLRARGGFVVTASKRAGRSSRSSFARKPARSRESATHGAQRAVTLFRNGKRSQQLKGALLTVRYPGG